MDEQMHKTMVSVATLEKIKILDVEFIPSEVRQNLKKCISFKDLKLPF